MDGFAEMDGIGRSSLRDRLSNDEVEVCFIGTVIMNPAVYPRVSWIRSDDFTMNLSQVIWDVMAAMYDENPGTSFDPRLSGRRLGAHSERLRPEPDDRFKR